MPKTIRQLGKEPKALKKMGEYKALQKLQPKTEHKLSATERRRAAERKMTQAQAHTNKRLKTEMGETYIDEKARLKRSTEFKVDKNAKGKYAYIGDVIYKPKKGTLRTVGSRKR